MCNGNKQHLLLVLLPKVMGRANTTTTTHQVFCVTAFQMECHDSICEWMWGLWEKLETEQFLNAEQTKWIQVCDIPLFLAVSFHVRFPCIISVQTLNRAYTEYAITLCSISECCLKHHNTNWLDTVVRYKLVFYRTHSFLLETYADIETQWFTRRKQRLLSVWGGSSVVKVHAMHIWGPEFSVQNLCKNAGMVAYVYNPSTGKK